MHLFFSIISAKLIKLIFCDYSILLSFEMISFDLTEIQEQVKETDAKFAQEEIANSVIERDINAIYPSEIVKKLGELGFMGFMVSPDWGGSGLDAVSYAIAQEEFCKVDASVGIIFSVHNSLVNYIVEWYGTNEQKERFLRPLASGEKLGAYCLSEPEAGSDATRQSTTTVRSGDKWILNGTKNWISSGNNADLFIVFANANPEMRHKGVNCYIIEKGTPGFEPGKKEDKMGMRSSDTCSIGLTNVELSDDNLIGRPGEGFKIAMDSLNGGRIGIAAQSVGIAQGAFEASVRYSLQRKSFGMLISNHQAIQMKLARMSASIEAARLLTHKAAWMKENHKNYIKASAEAKLFASNVANEVTREAVQIHGAYGYVREYQVERMMRDAKVTEIYEGTSEIQQFVIAREILKMFQ